MNKIGVYCRSCRWFVEEVQDTAGNPFAVTCGSPVGLLTNIWVREGMYDDEAVAYAKRFKRGCAIAKRAIHLNKRRYDDEK